MNQSSARLLGIGEFKFTQYIVQIEVTIVRFALMNFGVHVH